MSERTGLQSTRKRRPGFSKRFFLTRKLRDLLVGLPPLHNGADNSSRRAEEKASPGIIITQTLLFPPLYLSPPPGAAGCRASHVVDPPHRLDRLVQRPDGRRGDTRPHQRLGHERSGRHVVLSSPLLFDKDHVQRGYRTVEYGKGRKAPRIKHGDGLPKFIMDMSTACLYGMLTLIAPNFHICAPYLPNNFYSTIQGDEHAGPILLRQGL